MIEAQSWDLVLVLDIKRTSKNINRGAKRYLTGYSDSGLFLMIDAQN